MHLRHAEWLALAWAGVNLALCRYLVDAQPFPWLVMIGFTAAPLVFIFLAEHIAARLNRGLIERFASDWGKPQPAMPMRLVGWIALLAETLFLVFH